jgi:acetyltransferase-like isoleucine patch superfamily enzyme
MRRLICRLLAWAAHEHHRGVGLYRYLCQPGGAEWARYLKRHGRFYRMGEDCSIQTNVTITDPLHLSLGSNVRLSGCTLFGHDGSVNMAKQLSGKRLDRVGKLDIRDNVFIGHQAIVMAGVTIGPNAIVGAGAVVTRDVSPNAIVAGNPARVIGRLDEFIVRCEQQTALLPWFDHPAIAPDFFGPAPDDLTALRLVHFYGSSHPIETDAQRSVPHQQGTA